MSKFFRLLLLLFTVQVFPACNLSYADDDNCTYTLSNTEIPQDSTKTANNNIYVTGGEILSIVPGTISNITVVTQDAAIEKPTKTKVLPKIAVKVALQTTKKIVAESSAKSEKTVSKNEITNQHPISPPCGKSIVVSCGAPATVTNDFQKSSKHIAFTDTSYFSVSTGNHWSNCKYSVSLPAGVSQNIHINILFARPPTA